MLGHYNATITSLTMSADGGSLVSTDRDGKARVNVFPSNPLHVSTRVRMGAATPHCPGSMYPCCGALRSAIAVRL